TRPIQSITATASRIRPGNLKERIAGDGLPSEIALLAATFNRMLADLEDAFVRLSTFSADLAHELRTPVNNMREGLEVALGRSRTSGDYRATLASAIEDCVRPTPMPDALMFLARAELTHTEIPRTCVDVGEELAGVAEFHEPAASEAGLRLHVPDAAGLCLT